MNRAIQGLIVDDDKAARSILEKFLEINDKVNIVASVSETASAFDVVENNTIDVIFLDINMPIEDGIEFASKLRVLNYKTHIVFTTAYENYAVSAFNIKPVDFLVKPFGLNDIFNVVSKIENVIKEEEKELNEDKIWGNKIPDKLKFKTFKGYSFLNPDDIVFIKVVGANTDLILNNGKKERIFSLLNEIYDDIKKFGFLRINRSVIVNLKYVDRIDRKTRICIIKWKNEEVEFPLTRIVFKQFENMKLIRLG